MLKIDARVEGIKDLMVALGSMQQHLPRHLRAAVNKTAKSVRVQVAKELGKVMHLKSNYDPDFKKARTLKKVIKAKSMASIENATAVIQLSPGYEFPLKYYDAKPATKTRKKKKVYIGVVYRTRPAKIRSARITLTDAFIVNRWGHNGYRRQGMTRKPIVKVVGPAPGEYYDEIGASAIAVRVANERLPIELNRRVRAILLEQKGIIKLKASRGAR